MCLPNDEEILKKWCEFAVLRWILEHHILYSCLQATCLGMPMLRDDFMKIIRAYVDCRSENKSPQGVNVFWR